MQIFAIRMLKCACVSARLSLCVRVGVCGCVCSDNWNQNKTKTGNTIAKTAQVLWQCVSVPLCMCCLCAHSSCHIDKGHNRRYQSKQQERLCAVTFALAHLTLNVLQERGRERETNKRGSAQKVIIQARNVSWNSIAFSLVLLFLLHFYAVNCNELACRSQVTLSNIGTLIICNCWARTKM